MEHPENDTQYKGLQVNGGVSSQPTVNPYLRFKPRRRATLTPADYVDGLLMDFKPYSIVYSLIKTAVFAYIITSISAFYGYYAKGNSLEVGAASTRAVVASSVVIMIFNLILTQVLLI